MTVKDRIKAYCKAEKMTVSAFEDSIGASNGYVNAISKSIGIDKLNTIVEKFSNLNIEWLLTGRGEMLKTNRTSVEHTPSKDQSEQHKDTKNPTYKQEKSTPIARLASAPGEGIPLIPFEAMAGALTAEQTVLEYECERYVVPAFSGADFLMPVKGDSMLPTYKSGDLVACKRVPMSERFFQWNKAYVVDTNQGALIKRIKPAGKGHLYLISDNKDYDPIELPASSIYAVALVIGVIRLE